MFGRPLARRRVDRIGSTRLVEAQSDAYLYNLGDRVTSRSQQAMEAVRSHVQPGSFPLLLVTSLFVYVLNGLAVDSTAGAIVVQVGRVGVMCAGMYVLSANRVMVWFGVLVVGLFITLNARLWALDPQVRRVLEDSITVGFLLWVLVVVLREVFRPTTTERDAVVGALCGFVLILEVFLRLHGLLEALWSGSYHTDGPPLSERSDLTLTAVFQYFSTVTVTTVGFGDIVPVTPAARLATGLEAIVGQLYLAVVIATLVGRVAARRQ
jgi:voltage-gated potassium channel Kch